eukprot:COSAG02_NODE_5425_length_4343_cov_2.410697_2_plen_138_part_00
MIFSTCHFDQKHTAPNFPASTRKALASPLLLLHSNRDYFVAVKLASREQMGPGASSRQQAAAATMRMGGRMVPKGTVSHQTAANCRLTCHISAMADILGGCSPVKRLADAAFAATTTAAVLRTSALRNPRVRRSINT